MDLDTRPTRSPGQTTNDRHATASRFAAACQRTREKARCVRRTTAKVSAVARLRLRVTSSAESILRSGHPWLFADSVREQNRDAKIGELAVIYDRRDHFLGVGLYDPSSPIRVRILHVGKPQTIDREWWSSHLEEALRRRRGLFDEQ